MTITGNIELLEYFNFESNFLKNENLFKKLEYGFLVESIKIENTSFPCKTARHLEWGVQNGPITKNKVLPVNTLFFKRTSDKEMI